MKSQKHLRWVRSLKCSVPGCKDRGVVAHHVRNGTGGGTSIKPGDEWAIPLCQDHHHAGHTVGWQTFELRHSIDLREIAKWLAKVSPIIGTEPGAMEFLCL
jgi:hypothetical protein